MTSTHLLAARLLNNWLIKNPIDRNNTGNSDIDESLSDLGWLRNLNVGKFNNTTPTRIIHSPSSVYREVLQTKEINTNNSTEYRYHQSNGFNKPPYSYATLISMAINGTKEKRINISSIYKWITDNFPYYKMADSHWKNSIRHNLSLNKRFEKIPRRPNESGKGGYWRIKPEVSDIIQRGVITKRRTSDDQCFPPPTKRCKTKEEPLAVLNYDALRKTNFGANFSLNIPKVQKSVCKNDFNWSAEQQQYHKENSAKIKTENVIHDVICGRSITPVTSGVEINSIKSYTMSSPVSSYDDSSVDMTCFDDLLVFNCTDESRNIVHDELRDHQLNDDSLDLSLISDGSGDHDWWQKDFDCSENFNKNHGINTLNCSSYLDNDEIYIPPLDDGDNDIDICKMFNI
ncbi:hypothetical protein SNE40_014652 [Patella caerulea]|uniref:Fork-head domain-containing protein n=1 Tax=Patella caerulea TaxID=87958 RepID=A0AAN8PQV5_PATCE